MDPLARGGHPAARWSCVRTTSPFPPSRGRIGFELRHDGGYLETAIGPTDRPEEVTGTWTLAGDDTLVVTRASSSEPERVLRIVSAAPDRLVVAKG